MSSIWYAAYSAMQYPVFCISRAIVLDQWGMKTVWLMGCGTEDKPKKTLSFTEPKQVIWLDFAFPNKRLRIRRAAQSQT